MGYLDEFFSNWSQKITETSDALDIPDGLMTKSSEKVAEGVKKAADSSKRKKGSAFKSAMSWMNFYMNRAGKHLSHNDINRLNKAKNILRQLYGHSELVRAYSDSEDSKNESIPIE